MDNVYSVVAELEYGKNINDVIHLKFAERYCEKLITFDKDFKRLSPFSKISIEVIA
ncbi:PIN domain-containing protein [Desulfobacter postgatei 2ac9]|jgi:predicted nucleic acid-binding protein|uniref:PIN domain-containing protein n=2 Tax=Desulfobacter postgatei TaxID=2293 RepID=I5B6H0_9BACT|nr:PIN domain-containing protein [Desulfobacter postgatei]EIM65083.1 PIN domain-containing protein [Desulfobacter postgatei 2ac9]